MTAEKTFYTQSDGNFVTGMTYICAGLHKIIVDHTLVYKSLMGKMPVNKLDCAFSKIMKRNLVILIIRLSPRYNAYSKH